MRPRWSDGLDWAYVAFAVAALLIAALFAPPGPIHGAPGRYHVTAVGRSDGSGPQAERSRPDHHRKEVHPMPRSAYLTTAQVAERLHVSPKTVSRWAKDGKLAHTRTLGGHARYDPDQIERLARTLTVPTTRP